MFSLTHWMETVHIRKCFMQYSNFSQQFNSQLRMKTRLMTASRHFLYEQTLNLECCAGPSCESSSSVSSTNLVGFKSGDCLGHSNNVILSLWNQFRVLFEVCFGLLSYTGRSIYSMSHPYHPGGWQQIHFKNFWVHGSIHLPFSNIDFVKRKSPIPGCMFFFIWV